MLKRRIRRDCGKHGRAHPRDRRAGGRTNEGRSCHDRSGYCVRIIIIWSETFLWPLMSVCRLVGRHVCHDFKFHIPCSLLLFILLFITTWSKRPYRCWACCLVYTIQCIEIPTFEEDSLKPVMVFTRDWAIYSCPRPFYAIQHILTFLLENYIDLKWA